MKMEAWIFGMSTAFFVIVSPAYWLMSKDWTGTSALVMTTLLVAMITLYLGFHASKMDPRPEDRKEAEIADGAGELGFFPPYSWWPLVVRLHPRRDRLRRAPWGSGGWSPSAWASASSRSRAWSSSTTRASTRH